MFFTKIKISMTQSPSSDCTSVQNLFFEHLKFTETWLPETRLHALDLALKAPLHRRIPLCASEFNALLKSLDRARYVALAEMSSGFAKDARVT